MCDVVCLCIVSEFLAIAIIIVDDGEGEDGQRDG